MDEAWERAVETALEGRADASPSAPRTLTLDGVVKCLQGRMPSPIVLERFQTLEHLSLANIGLSSLEKFPRLRNLQRLILSDNRIAGGLEFLVEAGLDSLRDLDLSNNRIQYLEDLAPLAHLRLVSLDLYECPVTRISDYRSKVFGMIRSLKYLDKMDSEENERPESDDEDEEEDDEEEDDEDPGNGEVDGEDRVVRAMNGVGSSSGVDGIVDLDEDEESDADEEETDVGEMEEANGSSRDSRHHFSNGFIVQPVGEDVVEDEDGEDEEYVEDEDDLGEEVDAEEGGEEDDMVEIHEVEDSDEEDGVEEEEDEEEDEVDGPEDEVDAEDRDEEGDPSSTSRVISTEGEIDGHDLGEEDENGEIGEENGQVSGEDNEYDIDDGEEEEDFESEYLVQPVRPRLVMEGAASDLEIGDEEEDDSEEEVDDEDPDSRPGSSLPSSSSQVNKRKRDNDGEDDEDDGLDDDSVEDSRSSKRR